MRTRLAVLVAASLLGACSSNSAGSSSSSSSGTGGIGGAGGTSGNATSSTSGTTGTPLNCSAVTDGLYTVDPLNGHDDATGAASPDGCAFKTVTHALAVIGSSPPAGTVIQVRPTADLESPPETYPLTVPANTRILGISGGDAGVPLFRVGGLGTGFQLSSPASGLENLAITHANGGDAERGIEVSAGADATTSLKGVTVSDLIGDGILVTGGAVTIADGTHADYNGSYAEAGLVVSGGQAFIAPGDGGAQISFSGNRGYGIQVVGTGAINVHGGGNVVLGGNEFGSLVFWIDPSQTQQPSFIDGLVASGTGITISGGSKVTLRHTAVSGAPRAIDVERQATQGGPISDDVSGIDLGTASDPGRNLLPPPNSTSSGCGIILNVATNASQYLAAEGNSFGSINCLTGGTLTVFTGTVGDCNSDNLEIASGNDIDVASCTHN